MSLADYFSPKGDVAPLFIVTCGRRLAALEKELFASDRYSRYLLLHGFGVELAEALAAAMHEHIRRELGLDPGQGKRFSPGLSRPGPTWPTSGSWCACSPPAASASP